MSTTEMMNNSSSRQRATAARKFLFLFASACAITAVMQFRLHRIPLEQEHRSLAVIPPSQEVAASAFPLKASVIVNNDASMNTNRVPKSNNNVNRSSQAKAILNPLFSVCVVVTAFNVVEYIPQAIDSLFNQTYQNLHIVVVDDASTDGTPEKVQRVYNDKIGQKSRPMLDVIQLPHNTLGGTGQPSNIGMSACAPESRWIMFLDGDDYMESNAIQTMVAAAERLHADVVLADFDTFSVDENYEITATPSYDTKQWQRVPTNILFDPAKHADAIQVSPVPWRKIYRRSILLNNNVRFLEGDYFYEDNAFHWAVMTHTRKVAKINDVLFHHRNGREGQTSFSFTSRTRGSTATVERAKKISALAKLGGMFSNAHQIGRDIFLRDNPNSIFAQEFFLKMRRTLWIAKKQLEPALELKFMRRLDSIIYYWANSNAGQKLLAGESVDYIGEDGPMSREIDLSIIIPTSNVGEEISILLNKLFKDLSHPDFSFEVLVVDDASADKATTDSLLDFAKRKEPNFYLLSTQSSSGAGRARNMAIPLVEGKFVYFADADDDFDFAALRDAVKYAAAASLDVLLLPYRVEQVHAKNESIIENEMMPSDERIWKRIREKGDKATSNDLKREALSLINYPWKQITSSELIFTEDIFFGPTIVHNDVQFHWTSIAAADRIGFYSDKAVCTHRKFDPSVRGQLTSVKDEKRMGVIPALQFTQRSLTLAGVLDQEEAVVLSMWKAFVETLLKWASKQIPESKRVDFQHHQSTLLRQFGAATRIPATQPLPYWEVST